MKEAKSRPGNRWEYQLRAQDEPGGVGGGRDDEEIQLLTVRGNRHEDARLTGTVKKGKTIRSR